MCPQLVAKTKYIDTLIKLLLTFTITRAVTIYLMKLTQSTAFEHKRFDVRSLSPALRKLWLLY